MPKLCFPCPALGYVDDLVLCLRTDEIKDALAQVKTWSSNIRMQLNIGPNKSAFLGACAGAAALGASFGTRDLRLPVVQQFKLWILQGHNFDLFFFPKTGVTGCSAGNSWTSLKKQILF